MSRGRKSKKDHLLTALKQAILQQAIQGKLTADWRAENPDAEPASKLLKRIKAEKQKLIDEKTIRKEKLLPAIRAEEIPFDLPDGWVWCRLGEICSKTGSGSTPRGGKSAYVPTGIKFIRSQNVYDDGLRKTGIAYISNKTHDKMNGTSVQAEDLLLNITGGSIGRCCIVPTDFDKGNINQHVAIIRTICSKFAYYIHNVICSPYFQDMIIQVQTGAGREGLPKNKMDNILISLPPLPEQTAIVQKVEALMQKCDALEKGESIQHSPAIDEPADQLLNRYAVGRQLLAELPQQQIQVKQLKQAILQEAIQGKLTADWRSENPDIEPASELLKRIKAEKQKLIDEKKIRKEKPLPAIRAEEIPFDLPDGWVWCRMLNLSINIHYGATKSAKPTKQEVRLLRITDIQNNMVNWDNVPGCDFTKQDIDNYVLSENDILIARTGGTIGKSFLVKNISVKSIFASYLIRVIPSKIINAQYIKLFLESPAYWKQLFEAAWGAGQPNVNGTKLKNLIISLPPISEQTAIVQKVEALMQTCTDLEAQIKQSETHATQLMQAVIKEAFETENTRATP